MRHIQKAIIKAIESVQWAEIETQTMEDPRWVYDSRFNKSPDSPGPVLKFRLHDSFVYLHCYSGAFPKIEQQQHNILYSDPQLIAKIVQALETSIAANATRVITPRGTKYSKYRSYDG